jgi:hypothetical protein
VRIKPSRYHADMPSRLGVALIGLFWLATAGVVGYRDVWPRLFSDGPPPLRIDLIDEAAQAAPTVWVIYRGPERVGAVHARTEYVAATDTFRFVNSYRDLKVALGRVGGLNLTVQVPALETAVRVSRAGDLREQRLDGRLAVVAGPATLGEAKAEVVGHVDAGQLVGRVRLQSPFGDLDRPLDPVPVPAGQVLNPLLPVNRLQGVHPGRRWVVRQVDPLQDALDALVRQMAAKSEVAGGLVPPRGNRELVAEVKSAPERVTRKSGEKVQCWVIEYRGDEVTARTWVSVADGRVLRQEAVGLGERLRFERED